MSHQLIGRNADLAKLRNEGLHTEVRHGYLVIRDIPYVNSDKTVLRGTIFCELTTNGGLTAKPASHVCYWSGEHPCHASGQKLTAFENPSPRQDFGHGLVADFTFSAKADYRDFHHKMRTYIGRIAAEAERVDPTVTAETFPVYALDDEESVFKYVDTATSRAGIGAINEKIANQKIAIIGLGGTGAYILDLIAKTEVAEIHLFDGDVFASHNAFRAPGAATIEQLEEKLQKVNYYSRIYSAIRHRVIAHDTYIKPENIEELNGFDFVFICIDRGSARRFIVERLENLEIPFIDVGLGVIRNDNMLSGLVRVSTSTPQTRSSARRHLDFTDSEEIANDYATNIQVAELNSINASLAVIRWKRLAGIYHDGSKESYAGFSISANDIVSEEDA